MSGDRDRADVEARLREAFQRGSLPAAPDRLHAALERAAEAPVPAHARPGRRRATSWALPALAAVLVIGGVALAVGSQGPAPLPAPSVSPSPPASAAAGSTRITYLLQAGAGGTLTAEDLATTLEIVRHRVEATGVLGASVMAGGSDRIVVELPATVPADPIRRLVGTMGTVAIVPLGSESVAVGTAVDPAVHPPLISGAGSFTGAEISTSAQSGQPVLDLHLSSAAAETLRTWTAAHIGQYAALTVDRVAVSVPVIQTAIPGGNVEIAFAAADSNESRQAIEQLATLIRFGPLPVPLAELSVEHSPAPGSWSGEPSG